MFFVRIYLLMLMLLIMKAQGNTYDWLKTHVNQFWYNQYFKKCPPGVESKDLKRPNSTNSNTSIFSKENSTTAHCSRISLFENSFSEINQEIKEALFFDQALNDQALQNQCHYNYWNRLSVTDTPEAEKNQKTANAQLRTQFGNLKSNLKDFPGSENLPKGSKAAQTQIITQLTEQSIKIAELRREINQLAATNSVYSATGDSKSKEKIINLENQIKILESSMLYSEDQTVKGYVTAIILPKINNYYKTGKKINTAELVDYFLNDPVENFQKSVIESKLKSISEKQMSYAKINGKYNDNYNFKVQSIQDGAGARILNMAQNQNTDFSSIQCDLEAKYGKGEKAASNTNTAIISGVTVMFGGASFALARLSQIGMVSLRAAKLASTISSATNSAISAGMLSEGILNACFENQFTKNDHSICARADEQTQRGISEQLASEISQSDCLRDLGLSALAGLTSYKTFLNYKKIQREKQLADLGLKTRFDQIILNLNQNTELSSPNRAKIIAEINKSLKYSNQNGFPRDSFIQAMTKESPEDLYMALKQINSEHSGKTWTEKVIKWLERNGVKGTEAEELKACLIDQGDKVAAHCPLEKHYIL